MNKRESIIALYQYIAEVIKSLKTEKKDIYNEEWYYFLENLPKHSGITFNYLDNKNNLSNQKILQVEKLPFLKPLAIDEELLEWINGDWNDYKSSVKILAEKIVKANNSVKVVNISEKEKEKLEKLLKERNLWVEEQKKIEVVRKLFDTLYSKYLSLDRDSGTLELVVANGIVKVPNEDIYYPILLKKVNFTLDAEKNLISIIDNTDNDFITQELYLSFLAEVENISLDNVFKLEDKIVENNIHPISKNDVIKDFFREFIHNLNPRAQFIEDKEVNENENTITIEWKPILFIRKKDDGKVEAINNIIKNIEEGGEISGYLTELVGIVEDDKKEIENIPDILFTKETNNEQIEIVKNIYSHKAVVVQGPPGTGKTHTIANLLGHFLAEGKNVLITSQTRKALEVLKEKIPTDIQDLCISMLDDDNSDLGKSVESISEKLGYLNLDKLRNEYEELARNRNEVKKEIENIKRKICSIKHQESKTIIYNNESISLKEAGEFLRNNERELDKIPGIVSSGELCPINNEELDFLKSGYKKNVSEEEEKEIELGLNKISDFWSLEEFKEMLEAKKESISKIEKTLLKGKTKRLLVQGGDLFGKQVLAISHPSYAVSTAEYEAIDTNIKEFYEGKPLKPFTFKPNVKASDVNIEEINKILAGKLEFTLWKNKENIYAAQCKGVGNDVLDFRIDLKQNEKYLSFRSLEHPKKLENTEVYKNTFKEPFSIEVNAWFVEKFLNNYPQLQAIEQEIADDLLSLLNAIKAQQ